MSDFSASFALLMHNKIRIFDTINKQKKFSQLSILEQLHTNFKSCST